MTYSLGDVFIGRFSRIQDFGVRPDLYSARYGLRGHNGIDFGLPNLTPILAAADGWISEAGFDHNAYGNVIKIVHDGFQTAYGHLNDIAIKVNERVVKGQLIAHSGSSGLCDTPHLHFGVAACDKSGNKTQKDNGFGGYTDPMSALCSWEIRNLAAPINPQDIITQVSMTSKEYIEAQAQKTNLKIIVAHLIDKGLNEYLSHHDMPPIDLEANPGDSAAGENMVRFLKEIEIQKTHGRYTIPSKADVIEILSSKKPSRGFFFGLRKSLPFIFTQE